MPVTKSELSYQSSDDECNPIQNFDSCDDFEIMLFERDFTSIDQIEKKL